MFNHPELDRAEIAECLHRANQPWPEMERDLLACAEIMLRHYRITGKKLSFGNRVSFDNEYATGCAPIPGWMRDILNYFHGEYDDAMAADLTSRAMTKLLAIPTTIGDPVGGKRGYH